MGTLEKKLVLSAKKVPKERRPLHQDLTASLPCQLPIWMPATDGDVFVLGFATGVLIFVVWFAFAWLSQP